MFILPLIALGFHQQIKVTAPPASLHADAFYKKYVSADGIPILASGKVHDRALIEAANIVTHMLSAVRGDAVEQLAKTIRIAIIGAHEQTTDIPEYRNLNTLYPGTDWNKRTRGVGATDEIPVISAGEENLLGLPGDRYKGQGIFLHEFGHTIADMGVSVVDKSFTPQLQADLRIALANNEWTDTYAGSNYHEYWAVGTQIWFGCGFTSPKPNGVYNQIGTRAQLRTYDPRLYRMLESTYGDSTWQWHYPSHPLVPVSN